MESISNIKQLDIVIDFVINWLNSNEEIDPDLFRPHLRLGSFLEIYYIFKGDNFFQTITDSSKQNGLRMNAVIRR